MMRFLRAFALVAVCAPLALAAQTSTQLATAEGSRADVPVRDSAIVRLESFLTRYPNSALRPNALFQLGELLVRRADDRFAETQRATASADTTVGTDAPIRPDYAEAIRRYEELVQRFPTFDRADAAAYTLGHLYTQNQRYPDAVRMFEKVAALDTSRFQGEGLFRLGDAYFELAAKERGEPRRALFAKAAAAYEQATLKAPKDGDIYFLSLYKLGWSHYNQATQANQDSYRKAVDVFGQLVDAYEKLTPEQQNRLGLRGEAIEYMAIAFTQVGGAEAANRFFAERAQSEGYKLPVLRRVAQGLRDQGDFTRAVEGYRALIAQAPTDSSALGAQREIIDVYQNRIIEPENAQAARVELIEKFGPGSPWANANSGLAQEAAKAREEALRQAAQYELAKAQRGDRASYARATSLYERYITEFATMDSAQVVHTYFAEALFGQGDFARAGAEFSRAAYGYPATTDTAKKLAEQAGRSAIVAFDSALVRNKTDRAAQDSLFTAVDRFAAAYPQSDVAKKALVQKARRASETQRWDVMASTFRTYVERYPDDSYTPTARKLIGDALFKQGQYAEAQVQWESAQTAAMQGGRRALADSISRVRTAAAAGFADTLVKQGDYRRAAEDVYVAYADKNPNSERAPEALRDAIETYMLADSAARSRGDAGASRQAKERAIELSGRLVTQYPRFKFRLQYQALNAQLLSDVGRREEAATALQQMIADNPSWTGRADAMVRLAVTYDSLGKDAEAAAAYERFSAAYPRDRRAPDAQFNAAVTYVQAGDSATAARAYGTFASRYPRDERAAQAREYRVALLRASGDSTTANVELGRLCANPTSDAVRAECAGRNAATYFRQGVALWNQYNAMELVISSPAQLTAAGIQRASARKQALLRTMQGHFERSIKTGAPEYLSASTYWLGVARWEYGRFLRDVRLPASLNDEERAAGQAGAAKQAEQFFEAGRTTWQALITKAEQENIQNQWITRAREALQGQVPEDPPTAGLFQREPVLVGGDK